MGNILLNITNIRSHLSTALRNLPLDLHTQIDSTNTYLKRLLLDTNLLLPRICLAEQQTMGKGQTNKSWHSPFGQNIYLSIAFSFTQPLQALEGFSLVTALAIIKVLAPYVMDAINLKIKWPNDVFYGNQKLAGILLETVAQNTQQTCVIVGIGINVNMQGTLENNIGRPWTSLALISGKSQDRNNIVADVIEQFFTYLNLFEHAGFAPFLDQWEPYDFLRGKEVSLQTAKDIYRGIAAGINTRGQLLIKAPGRVSAHTSGQLNIL